MQEITIKKNGNNVRNTSVYRRLIPDVATATSGHNVTCILIKLEVKRLQDVRESSKSTNYSPCIRLFSI